MIANFEFDVLETLVFDDNDVIEDVRMNRLITRNTLDCVALFSVYIDALDPGSRGRLRLCGGGCDEHAEYDRAEQDPNQCLIGGEQTALIESNSTRVSPDVFYIEVVPDSGTVWHSIKAIESSFYWVSHGIPNYRITPKSSWSGSSEMMLA